VVAFLGTSFELPSLAESTIVFIHGIGKYVFSFCLEVWVRICVILLATFVFPIALM